MIHRTIEDLLFLISNFFTGTTLLSHRFRLHVSKNGSWHTMFLVRMLMLVIGKWFYPFPRNSLFVALYLCPEEWFLLDHVAQGLVHNTELPFFSQKFEVIWNKTTQLQIVNQFHYFWPRLLRRVTEEWKKILRKRV